MNFVGFDEYFFIQLYKVEWYYIYVKYVCLKWFYEMRDVKFQVIYFFGDKLWEEEVEWEGLCMWREVKEGMV